jgi:putative addiction module component (TIGR02574 family)
MEWGNPWSPDHRLRQEHNKRMTQQALELLQKALTLPVEDRTALIRSLIESLEEVADEGVERAWDEEIGKRIAELDSGKAKTISGKKSGSEFPPDSPMAVEVTFHEGASSEYEAAFEWYFLRSEFAASRFAEEMD